MPVNWLIKWHMRHWTTIPYSTYCKAYNQWGGSFITHPEVIQGISELLEIPVMFQGRYEDDKLVAAVPTWGNYIAGSKGALKKLGKRGLIDVGNPEVILPMSPNIRIVLPYKSDFISYEHQPQIINLKNKGKALCLAKGFHAEGFSKKFKYNHRREIRLFQDEGGEFRSVNSVSADQLCELYLDLFEKRWGFSAKGATLMHKLLEKLYNFLTGTILYIADEPIATQLVYQVETMKHFSVEYVNGGVNPSYKNYSPGSILSFSNIQQAQALADSKSKPLRYSFGLADNDYKLRWCNKVPVFLT